jgi:hypothetical protein
MGDSVFDGVRCIKKMRRKCRFPYHNKLVDGIMQTSYMQIAVRRNVANQRILLPVPSNEQAVVCFCPQILRKI